MVDKRYVPKYNEYVIVITQDDKTVYKLYRAGELVYIGVKENDSELGFDERAGTANSSGHDC